MWQRLYKFLISGSAQSPRRNAPRFRPRIEALEDRLTPSTTDGGLGGGLGGGNGGGLPYFNDPPTVANPIGNQAFTGSGSKEFTFPADTFRDADGDPLTYTAARSDGSPLPAWLQFDGTTRTFSGNPAVADQGSYGLKVTARDSWGNTASTPFSLAVSNANDAPTVANPIPPARTTLGDVNQMFTFAANTFRDADGDALTFVATAADGSALPPWLQFDAGSRSFRVNPAASDVGNFDIKVTADDGHGGTANTAFRLTVSDTSQPSDLRVEHGFHFAGSYAQNFYGHMEKWFQDRLGGWWSLTPDGSLRHWDGVSFASSPVVATLSPLAYDDPNLLFQAAAELSGAELQGLSDLRVEHGFHFAGSYAQNFYGHMEKWFQDRLGGWWSLTPDGSLRHWDGVSFASSPVVATLSPLAYDDPNLLFQAAAELSGAELQGLSDLRVEHGFHFAGSYAQNFYGHMEKWFQDRLGGWWSLTPDGSLRHWDGVSFASSPVVATLSPLAYDDPNLLFQAAAELSGAELQGLSDLRVEHGFHFAGSYAQNFYGHMEKWFQDRLGGWWSLTPDGSLRHWDGVSFASSPVVATLSPLAYDDPNLLFQP